MLHTLRHLRLRTLPPVGILRPGILALTLAWFLPGSAAGLLVTDPTSLDDSGAKLVFSRMADAWLAGNARGVTDLVHPDGLTVITGPNAERRTHYSPSQAFYYFKNLFQSHQTIDFAFEKVQGGVDAVRAHGMAAWKRRRPGQDREQVVKLMCILVRVKDGWKLAEIHTIR